MAKIYGVTDRSEARPDYSVQMEEDKDKDIIGEPFNLEEPPADEPVGEGVEVGTADRKPAAGGSRPGGRDYISGAKEIGSSIVEGVKGIAESAYQGRTGGAKPSTPVKETATPKTEEKPYTPTEGGAGAGAEVETPELVYPLLVGATNKQHSDIYAEQDKVIEDASKESVKNSEDTADLWDKWATLAASKPQVAKENDKDDWKEIEKIRDGQVKRAEDLMKMRETGIDPNRAWGGEGLTWRRIVGAISIFMAGIGGPAYLNAAMKNINGAIQRDIDAQKAELKFKGEQFGVGRNILSDLLATYGKKVDAESIMKEAKMNQVKGQIQMKMAMEKSFEKKQKYAMLLKKAADDQKKERLEELKKFAFPQGPINEALVHEDEVFGRLVNVRPGLSYMSRNENSQKEATKVVSRYQPVLKVMNEIVNFTKKNPGFMKTGRVAAWKKWPSRLNKKLDQLHARLIIAGKVKDEMGANFTLIEKRLLDKVYGYDLKSFLFGQERWEFFMEIYNDTVAEMTARLNPHLKTGGQGVKAIDYTSSADTTWRPRK